MSNDPTDDVDPFEDIAPEETPDRDPFDEFEPDDDEEDSSESTGSEDTSSEAGTEPAQEPFEGINVTDQHSGETDRPADADPFADLTEDDPFEGGEWDASGADESVWESLSAEPEIEVEEKSGRRISTVNKHNFCERCEYFTEPPEISCTHAGTEIMAFVDIETVRVADCPIVEERERLEGTSKQRTFESDDPK